MQLIMQHVQPSHQFIGLHLLTHLGEFQINDNLVKSTFLNYILVCNLNYQPSNQQSYDITSRFQIPLQVQLEIGRNYRLKFQILCSSVPICKYQSQCNVYRCSVTMPIHFLLSLQETLDFIEHSVKLTSLCVHMETTSSNTEAVLELNRYLSD